MGGPTLQRADWLARFEAPIPAFASLLLAAVQRAPVRVDDLRTGAESLGVLRAQQGHTVAGLVEDLLALRGVALDDAVVDTALRLAISAYVDELTVVLTSKATRDPLTGLPNRAAFDEALGHEVATASRSAAPSLLLVDLDRFKLVNDTDGHLAGDLVLVGVAEVMRTNVRPSDVVCRLGGDEFAVVLPRTNAARAQQIARRLLNASHTAAGLASLNVRVTFSIGIAWQQAPSNPAALVQLADAALYEVKAAGGDGIRMSE